VPDRDPVHRRLRRQRIGQQHQQLGSAAQRFAPEAPSKPAPGRAVPVAPRRAVPHLGFQAIIALEDLDPDLLADLDELDT
jgi:hypothetical protein